MSSYLLKIVLRGTPNLIWRRFVVPSYTPLCRLHDVIQTVMGWEQKHPHVFYVRKQSYHSADYDAERSFPESLYSLADLAYRTGSKLKYIYDPNKARWIHDITIESIRYVNPSYPSPFYCLEGVRACPPESCNGVTDFIHFLKVKSDPHHPEHVTRQQQWGSFDSDRFDLEKVNKKFGVNGSVFVEPSSVNENRPPKVTISKRGDFLYRLGQKLKQHAITQ
jgi:hypothetical protein